MSRLFSTSDIILGLRLIRKEPLLTFSVVLALATGIGMATTGFTLLEAVLWARLPFAGGEQFVLVTAFQEPDARRASIEPDRLLAFREGIPALSHVGAVRSMGANLRLPSGNVALVRSVEITPDSFAFLPYAPIVGRALNAEDARAGAPAVAVIRESLWRRLYSRDPAIVGTAVEVGGIPRTIVGVMPDGLEFPNSPEMWTSIGDMSGARVFGVLAEASTPEAVARRVAPVRGLSR